MAFIQCYQIAFVEIVAFFESVESKQMDVFEKGIWTHFGLTALCLENQWLSQKSVHKEKSLKLVGE